jgi:mannobiose 2-epimerase
MHKKQEALDYARKLFRLIESVWHDGTGYLEQLTRDYQPMKNEELSENGILAERTMNTILHIMEAYTVLYEVTGDPDVRNALVFCVKQLTNEMYNPIRSVWKSFLTGIFIRFLTFIPTVTISRHPG